MITYEIIRKGRFLCIVPIPQGVLANTLLKNLSYEKIGIEYIPIREWGIVKLYNINKGLAPWGLLNRIKLIFDKYIEVYKDAEYKVIQDTPSLPENIIFNNRLRPYQVNAIKALINAGGSGIISVATGGGKTFIMLEYLKILNRKSLVIVPTLDIRNQWNREIKENYSYLKIDIYNYQNKILKEKVKEYDVIVCDECHRASIDSIYKPIMHSRGDAIVVGCSGTPWRQDNADLKLESSLGNIVYKVDAKTLIEGGFLSEAKVYYLHSQYPNDGKYLKYSEVYKTNIVENEYRNNMIANLALKESSIGKHVLILVTQIAHGNILYEDLKFRNPKIIFMHGSVKERNIDYSKYEIIIGSTIYDEGVNFTNMDVLILACGNKSAIRLLQRVGRVLRKNINKDYALIYDFVDTPKYLKRHYRIRRDILSEQFEVTEI